MNKTDLILKIQTAFQNVALEDGIGLWEARALDDYADDATRLQYKAKDERLDWNNISFIDVAKCYTSLSFVDAKGMRFCLPKFLLLDILHAEAEVEYNIEAPEVLFTLTYELNTDYSKNRFSLLDKSQIQAVIYFIEHKIKEMEAKYKTYFEYTEQQIKNDNFWIEANEALKFWETRLNKIQE